MLSVMVRVRGWEVDGCGTSHMLSSFVVTFTPSMSLGGREGGSEGGREGGESEGVREGGREEGGRE